MPISDTQALLSFIGACSNKQTNIFSTKLTASCMAVYKLSFGVYKTKKKQTKKRASMFKGYALKARLILEESFRDSSRIRNIFAPDSFSRLHAGAMRRPGLVACLESLKPLSKVNIFYPNKRSRTFQCVQKSANLSTLNVKNPKTFMSPEKNLL